MNILILTKLKSNILEPHHKNVNDYIKDEHFFNGWNEAFKKLGHSTFLNWEESVFFPQKLKIKFPFLIRVIRFVFKFIGLSKLDRYIFSKKIAKFCHLNDIDVIFTEINNFISPRLIKKNYPKVKITQWYGVFPEMSNNDILKILPEYDYIWGPCEFYKDQINFKGIEKFHYIGCAVNDQIYYNEYDDKFNYEIVFVGGVINAHSNRIKTLEAIAQKFDDFAFYGYGVENLPRDYKLRKKFKGWISSKNQRKLYSSSKVALNFTLNGYEKIKKGFNVRLFEIAACGGAIQLCKFDKKIEEFFLIGKDLDCFENSDDLITKIDFYLKNKKERDSLAQNSLYKSNQYTYLPKAKKILEIIHK